MPKHQPQPEKLPEGLLDLTPEFQGFHPPTSNTIYTLNQFFDVCLPHSPRGVAAGPPTAHPAPRP